MNLRKQSSVKGRRGALEKELKVSLKHIGSFSLDESVAGSRNCENMIGVAQIPLGIAGPLKISNFKFQISNYYFIPLATTEGALVASVNRGCKAIAASGGAMVASERVGATRGPVFRTGSLSQALTLKKWLTQHFKELDHLSKKTSSHLRLLRLDTRAVGRLVYVRFYFDTQDAMGMNMATLATTLMGQFIEEETGAKCVSVAGNFCTDKKPAWQNSVNQRGIAVWAEVQVPAQVLRAVLKTTAKKIYDVWLAKCLLGSALSGSLGFNAHHANVLAAIFAATGQDLAHVGEVSLGITTAEVMLQQKSEDLYLSVYLPDLMVGTVGGGTGLATQKEALEILGVAGGNRGENSQRLAEITGAAVLAGELSLLASLAEGTLACAHERLARGHYNTTNPTNVINTTNELFNV